MKIVIGQALLYAELGLLLFEVSLQHLLGRDNRYFQYGPNP